MLIVYYGDMGAGKTHIIYNKYSVIKIDRDNRSLSYLLLDSMVDSDGREKCAWINCSTEKPTEEEWNMWFYWSQRASIPIVVELRDNVSPIDIDEIIKVEANADQIKEYTRLNGKFSELTEGLTDWWRVKSLVAGNLTASTHYRGFGDWDDPIEEFADKPLDPKLIQMVLGAVRQFPSHYLVIKAINETSREQGVTPEMIRPLITVLPRRVLSKKWAIPYLEQDGSPFMRWLLSAGLDRMSYYASLDFELDTQYALARRLKRSPYWKAGWKALKKKAQSSLSIEEILNVVFKNPLDTLRDDLDIRAII